MALWAVAHRQLLEAIGTFFISPFVMLLTSALFAAIGYPIYSWIAFRFANSRTINVRIGRRM